ncbi:hypothetical protein ACFE04_017582 [Oxalis oulophora]
MSGRGGGGRWKRKDGSGEETEARPNKSFKSSSYSSGGVGVGGGASRSSPDADDDNLVVCEISKNRRVSVRNWQGKVWIDIRECYQKDGNTLPGKKGISISVDQWNILRDHAPEIHNALASTS